MTIQGDQLRMAADGFEAALDRAYAMRVSPAWTGPAAERFDQELRAWRQSLHQIAAGIRTVAARVDKEITGH
jgi:uncharacterized protein YukE